MTNLGSRTVDGKRFKCFFDSRKHSIRETCYHQLPLSPTFELHIIFCSKMIEFSIPMKNVVKGIIAKILEKSLHTLIYFFLASKLMNFRHQLVCSAINQYVTDSIRKTANHSKQSQYLKSQKLPQRILFLFQLYPHGILLKINLSPQVDV